MSKESIRKSCRTLRDNLSVFEKNVKENMVINKLLQLPEIQQAKIIASYKAMGSELYLDQWNDYLSLQGKKIVFPRTENGQMEFYYGHEFEKGEYGILVPKLEKAIKIEKKEIDVIIAPLVAFNKQCYRLGQGKGYYDKYLRNYYGCSIGVGFACQKVEDLPVEPFDRQLDMIISEEEILTRMK